MFIETPRSDAFKYLFNNFAVFGLKYADGWRMNTYLFGKKEWFANMVNPHFLINMRNSATKTDVAEIKATYALNQDSSTEDVTGKNVRDVSHGEVTDDAARTERRRKGKQIFLFSESKSLVFFYIQI